MYAGEGPPGEMLDVDLLQRSPTQKPPKEVSTWGGVPGLLSTRFFWRNRFQEGQVIFFFGPINSNVKEELQNRASLSRIYSSLAEASPMHWAADVQNNLTAGGGT